MPGLKQRIEKHIRELRISIDNHDCEDSYGGKCNACEEDKIRIVTFREALTELDKTYAVIKKIPCNDDGVIEDVLKSLSNKEGKE